jgi:hypothetical protein
LQRSNVNADGAWSVWEQRIQPFLEGRVPRVDRLRLGAFGLSLGVNDVALEGRDLTEYQGFRDFRRARTTFPFKPSSHEADFEGLFADPVFEDLLAERWLRIENTVRDISALKSMIEKIIELTEAELGMPESI